MNIESSQITKTNEVKQVSQSTVKNDEGGVNFSDELEKLKPSEELDENKQIPMESENENLPVAEEKLNSENEAAESTNVPTEGIIPAINKEPINKEINLQKNKVDLPNLNKEILTDITNEKENEFIGSAIENLNSVLNELNNPEQKMQKNENKQVLIQRDDNEPVLLKNLATDDDNQEEGENLINNDFNIDNKDKLPQMTSNMNFSGDGQPFSSFMNNEESSRQNDNKLVSTAKELEEENAILSTMAENMAMVNKANIDEPKVKVVSKNDGIKKVDTKTNIVQETIVKYDTVIMNEADVEVFAGLVQNKEVNLNNLAPEAAQKSVHVSKTLAEMLVKSMEENKPVRIEFDNGISVIIKISRDGKLSADFLPSTQVAEAYLKENLPILKQRFDEQNIDYDELNRRERRNQDKEQNRKKGRENE